ncbi:hypothetical protein QQ1_2854 [Clostridioides difficile Y247]|nr:hypothetical protein QQ1_2854 [Clostridioides difficile Y247]
MLVYDCLVENHYKIGFLSLSIIIESLSRGKGFKKILLVFVLVNYVNT